MRYLSLFAGVGGFDLGADAAGWECVGQVEWDKHCQRVLARHWPDVPKWGDVRDATVVDGGRRGQLRCGGESNDDIVSDGAAARRVGSGPCLPTADVVVGGFPCQDVSVAGNRKGIATGTRSGLYGQIIRIVKEMRHATAGTSPRWVILENVAGLLSIDKGAGFGRVLDDLADMGALVIEWGLADTQFFGPPQRRRRVFIVACLDPDLASRCPDPLLPLSESLPGHLATRRQAGSVVAALTSTGVGTCGADDNQAQAGHLMPVALHHKSDPFTSTGRRHALTAAGAAVAYPVAVSQNQRGGSSLPMILAPELVVRRLMPIECERLQGWPDDWARWAADGTEIPDSHRYRMCGNGISAPVARWVAEQINRAES